MLFLVFQLSREQYAVPARDIVEVLPLTSLRRVPTAPAGLGGILDFRGEPIPVIDLALMSLGRPSAERLSTRLIIFDAEDFVRFGIVAEFVHQTIRLDPAEFVPFPVRLDGASYLGPVAKTPAGLIQRIDPSKLLTPKLKAALAEACLGISV